MREDLAKFVCAFDMPFTLVEEECFTCFIQTYLQPVYQPISRNTLRSDIQSVFNKPKKRLIEDFSTFNCTIACTSNFWTSCNKIGYICITTQFIEENWNINKISKTCANRSRNLGLYLTARFSSTRLPNSFILVNDVPFKCVISTTFIRKW